MRIDPIYPITIALALAVVIPGIVPGKIQRDRVNMMAQEAVRSGWIVSGDGLSEFTSAAGTAAIFLPESNPRRIQARANRTREQAPGSPGLYYTLAPPLMRAYAGKEIEVSVTLRAAPSDGAERTEINFFMLNASASGWNSFEVPNDFQTVNFRWRIPVEDSDRPGLVAFWPDQSGQNKGIEVRDLSVKLTGK
jgi:hypothetical protein